MPKSLMSRTIASVAFGVVAMCLASPVAGGTEDGEKGRVFKSLESFADAVNMVITAQACKAATRGEARNMDELRQWWEDEVAGRHKPDGGYAPSNAPRPTHHAPRPTHQQYQDFFFGRIHVGDDEAVLLAVDTGNLDDDHADAEAVALVTLFSSKEAYRFRGESRLYVLKKRQQGYHIIDKFVWSGSDKIVAGGFISFPDSPSSMQRPPVMQLVDFNDDGLSEIVVVGSDSSQGNLHANLQVLATSTSGLTRVFDSGDPSNPVNRGLWTSLYAWSWPHYERSSVCSACIGFQDATGDHRTDLVISRYFWRPHDSKGVEKILHGHVSPDFSLRFVFTYSRAGGFALANSISDRVNHHDRAARQWFSRQRYDRAIQEWEQALALDAQNPAMRAALAEARERQRGRDAPALQATLRGHASGISGVVFSPDGRFIASSSYDRAIKIWDVGTGREIQTLEGHDSNVNCLAFSPDGRLLASGSDYRKIKLWDAATGHEVRTLTAGCHHVSCIVFSPDGRLLAAASNPQGGETPPTTQIWEVDTGRVIRTFGGHKYGITSVAFSPDGWLLAVAGGHRTVKLWEMTSGRQVRSLDGMVVWDVAFSPDGHLLALGLDEGHDDKGEDYSIKLCEVSTGRVLRTLRGHKYRVNCVAFSPDGRMLASGSNDDTLRIWGVAMAKETTILRGHDGWVWDVAFSPDSQLVASASWDDTIKLWRVGGGL